MILRQLIEPYNNVDANAGNLLKQQLFVNAFPTTTKDGDHYYTNVYYNPGEDKAAFAETSGDGIRNMLDRITKMSASLAVKINFE